MKMRLLLLPAFLYLVALPSHAAEELDVTLTIIENEAFSEDSFINEISLPVQAAEQAHDNAGNGVETSNQARQQGSQQGAQRSQDARDNGGQGNRPDIDGGQGNRPDVNVPSPQNNR